jgi:FkbM family methyltransferase
MNKKELFLKQVESLESNILNFAKKNKIEKAFVMNKKALVKYSANFLFNLFKIKIIKKVKTFWNKYLYVYLHDYNAKSLYFWEILPYYELPTIKFLIKNLNSNDIFYDIGANYGFYTLLAAEFIKKGEIHAFEPNPDVFRLLNKTLKEQSFDFVKLNSFALSNFNGNAYFSNNLLKGHSGGSSLYTAYPKQKFNHLVQVNTITLDDYIKSNKVPNILKVDIEGAEILLIEGARKFLMNNNNITIIMEIWSKNFYKVFSTLKSLGFSMYLIDNSGNLKLMENPNLLQNKLSNLEIFNFVFKK